jgi:uncharacterized metal-binding protein (TIGR02443 family)
MATNQKYKPCPVCLNDDNLSVFDYDGTKHVECIKCNYLGPASGSVRWAIKLHNEDFEKNKAAYAAREQANDRA